MPVSRVLEKQTLLASVFATCWLEMGFCPAEPQWCFQTLTLFWNDV